MPFTTSLKILCVAACAALLSVSALAAPAAGAKDQASPRAGPVIADWGAIRRNRLAQNAAIFRGDLDAIAAYWTDDVTSCSGLGLQLAGKAAYRKLFADDPATPVKIVYERIPKTIEASQVWPLAFEAGVWMGHVGTPEGPVVIQGQYSAQWVKRSGNWLIRSEVYVALSGSGDGLKMKAVPCSRAWPGDRFSPEDPSAHAKIRQRRATPGRHHPRTNPGRRTSHPTASPHQLALWSS